MTLALDGIRKALPAFEIAVDLALGDETLALVGPSGAGKSSILRMVAGLLEPDEGRISVSGETVFDAGPGRSRVSVPPESRGVALVFQDYALFPHLSVRANVAFGPRSTGRRRADATALANGWLERLGIVNLADQRPRSLSGGERQRVAIARALASEPEALLLDEPLSALDAVTKSEVAAELSAELRSIRAPTVLVSHDFADVVGLADRIAVIERGRIVQVGDASELLEAPASSFVAGFTGVNYFTGVAARRDDLTEVRSLDGVAAFVSTDPAEGAVSIVVLPWEVSVSASMPQGSALNALAGPIRRVAVVGNRARVTVGSDPPIVAEVTEDSVRRMRLAPGVRVVATWKATGTRLVPRVAAGPSR